MNWDKPILEGEVKAEWVDYNGHMNDAAYALMFSQAVGKLMDAIGIDEYFFKSYDYTIYTLETHLVYLKETMEGEAFTVDVQLINHDEKRLHVFFTMYSEAGETLATSEQMLLGVDQTIRRAAPFPPSIYEKIKELQTYSNEKTTPTEVGRKISL